MANLNPNHLLEQAERLLERRSEGPSRTLIRQVDRRRAISAAYYAVFHAVLADVADLFVGHDDRKSPRYTLVYRHIDHRQLEQLCSQAIKQQPDKRYQPFFPEQGFEDAIRKFASSAVQLKADRNSAEYDPSHWVRIVDARLAIKQARKAIEAFTDADQAQREIFLTLLAFPPR